MKNMTCNFEPHTNLHTICDVCDILEYSHQSNKVCNWIEQNGHRVFIKSQLWASPCSERFSDEMRRVIEYWPWRFPSQAAAIGRWMVQSGARKPADGHSFVRSFIFWAARKRRRPQESNEWTTQTFDKRPWNEREKDASPSRSSGFDFFKIVAETRSDRQNNETEISGKNPRETGGGAAGVFVSKKKGCVCVCVCVFA